MKNTKKHFSISAAVLATAFIALPSTSEADLVNRVIVSDGKPISSAYVFQGSSNMKRYKSRSVTSTRVVPVFSLGPTAPVSTVLSPLATQQIQPKPRFGYGSDYNGETKGESKSVKNPVRYHQPTLKGGYAPAPAPAPVVVEAPVYQGNVIQFQSPRSTTEYWPVVPFYQTYGPSYGGYGCDSYGYGPSHSSFGPASVFSRLRSRISVRLSR